MKAEGGAPVAGERLERLDTPEVYVHGFQDAFEFVGSGADFVIRDDLGYSRIFGQYEPVSGRSLVRRPGEGCWFDTAADAAIVRR